MGASTMSAGGFALNSIGGLMNEIGLIKTTQATAGAAGYNAAIERENAARASANVALVSQEGDAQVGSQSLKTRATQGALTTNAAAGGESVNTGSIASSVRPSEAEIGQLDALTVRSNATKEAYGYEVQSQADQAQATLSSFEQQSDLAAMPYEAMGTLLGSTSSGLSNYANFMNQSGNTLNGSGGT